MTERQQSFSFGPTNKDKAPREAPSRRNLVIEAGAGTGKTTRIVKEVVGLLLDNPDLVLERIVLMTFTEKAAGEIADRIRAALTDLASTLDQKSPRWPSDPDKPAIITIPPNDIDRVRRACTKHLGQIDRLRSQTIHSFCQNILRLYPIEAGLTPQFRIVEGYERGRLLHDIYGAWLEKELTPGTLEERLIEWRMLYRHYLGLDRLEETLTELIPRGDLIRDESLAIGNASMIDDQIRSSILNLRNAPLDDLQRVTDELQAAVITHVFETKLPEIVTVEAWIEWFEPIETELQNLKLNRGPRAVQKLLKPLRGKKWEQSFLVRLRRHQISEVLRSVTVRFLDFLERAKEDQGVVDFDDLLMRTQRLLRDERVLEEVRSRYDYIFVDEFQDTDRVQAWIIDRLARDRRDFFVSGKVTLVGDPKQSIYAFRSADPETYRDTVGDFRRGEAEHSYLSVQHRSDPLLLDALNLIFGTLFPERSDQDPNVFTPTYSALEAAKPLLSPESEPRVRFVLAPVADDVRQERLEAEAVAEWVDKHRGREKGALRAFAVLMRRATHFQLFADALARRGIAAIMPASGSFLDQPAVVDLLAVLRAVSHPFDLAAQISAARSPYFAITDDEIFSHRFNCDRENDGCPYAAFLEKTDTWRSHARHTGVLQTIDMIIEETPIEAFQRVARDGDRDALYVDRLIELAARFDAERAGSLNQFVDELSARRDSIAESEPTINDERSDAVRIMTIHGAKGLEFDRVILPDLAFITGSDSISVFRTAVPPFLVFSGNLETISAWASHTEDGEELREVQSRRDEAEDQRLLYVAATRAKAELVFVVPNGVKSTAGFMKHLYAVFGKESLKAHLVFGGEPEMRELDVESGRGRVRAMIEPIELSEKGDDPSRFKLHDVEALVRSADGLVESEKLSTAIRVGREPGRQMEAAEASRRTAANRNRRAGILLHRVLEVWSGDEHDLDGLVNTLAAESGAESAETELVLRRAHQVSRSENFEKIRSMKSRGAEQVIHFLEEGRLREGRVDKLLVDGEALVVLDYKSGTPDPERLDRDRKQVLRYCSVVGDATGRTVKGVLWYIDGENDELVEVGD